jgi:hypothetical protein
VALWMTRALEALDATLRRMEQGEIDAWRLDRLLIEELNVRANRRVRWHSLWHRLTAIKSLAGFDFAFRPHSTDSASWHWPSLPSLTAPLVHLLRPPGTGKTHLACS